MANPPIQAHSEHNPLSVKVEDPSPTLQVALHAATRSVHAQLNKTIMARLPLGLPPNTCDPTAYYLGILAFGQIYLQFERAIESVLLEHSQEASSSTAGDLQTRHVEVLKILHTEGLIRTQALRHDLDVLQHRLDTAQCLTLEYKERTRAEAEAKTAYILSNIQSKPYLALAYTWTMYLALFNGGRWLHKELARAGSEFWLDPTVAQNENSEIDCLSFWHFDAATSVDPGAEKLKLEFKRRFEEASALLTSTERDEVVEEAQSLFELCMSLISFLDDVMIGRYQRTTKAGHTDDVDYQTASGRSTSRATTSNLLDPIRALLNFSWRRPLTQDAESVE